MRLNADFVATGHYCRKEEVVKDNHTYYRLLAGLDPNKDQSYFLCQLSQEQLKHAKEEYDYRQSERFVKKNGLKNVTLLRIDTSILPDCLYCTNGVSPLFKQLVADSRGVILFGGPDIPPATYGETTNLLTVITDPYRHYMASAGFIFFV